VCDALQPYPQCMLMIEKIICGATCNPDSGTYIVKKGGEVIMTVCQEFANTAYKACKDVEIQGVAMNQLIPDVQNMMVYVTNYIANFMGIENFNIAIGTRPCLTGAAAAPTYTPCCDPSAVDPKCPAGSVDKVKYAPYINRTINSTACTAGAPQAAPAPSPPRDAPAAPAPAPSTPAAPAPSVVSPAAPAPAPPAPNAGTPPPSPQAPGVAPSTTPPASPSPTTASPSPPSPPPKSGARPAASLMSMVALAAGAAVLA
ncbi:unnamed protein product, partial [Closterium sp. NIES-54]